MTDESPSLACNLGVLGSEELARHREVARELQAVAEQIDELPDGYRFKLPAESRSIELAAEFISRERLCCPFVGFKLTVPEGAASVECEFTGPPGAKEVLRGGLGLT